MKQFYIICATSPNNKFIRVVAFTRYQVGRILKILNGIGATKIHYSRHGKYQYSTITFIDTERRSFQRLDLCTPDIWYDKLNRATKNPMING